MHVRRVDRPEDVELVREIRNSGRENMTSHTRCIGPAEQLLWWKAQPREIYLFDDVAFAYISERGGRKWITLAVLPEHRGNGIGTAIYRLFRGAYAEIRKDNHASRRAAEKAGFKVVEERPDTVVMHR